MTYVTITSRPGKDPAHFWKSGFGQISMGGKYVVHLEKCSNFVHGPNKIVRSISYNINLGLSFDFETGSN